MLNNLRHAIRGRLSARLVAFTLIELVIVVALVAILAAIAVPQYQNHIKLQKIQSAKLDLGVISAAAEDNFQMYGSFSIPNSGGVAIVGSAQVSSQILLDDINLATSGTNPPYSFNFHPSGSDFYVVAVPSADTCAGCPSLRLDRGSSEIIFN